MTLKQFHSGISEIMNSRGFKTQTKFMAYEGYQCSAYWVGEDLQYFFTNNCTDRVLALRLTKDGSKVTKPQEEVHSIDLEDFLWAL